MAFRHQIRVRYGEVDMQQVVFNAHYLAYVDDAVDTWFRSLFGTDYTAGFADTGWDIMLKKATVDWSSPARLGDVLDLDVAVARWGRSSFDVGVAGQVQGRAVFTATITYVGVRHGTVTPIAAPEKIRTALGDAITLG